MNSEQCSVHERAATRGAQSVAVCGAVAAVCASLALAGPPEPKVLCGIDVLIGQDFAPLRGRRIGLITNPTGLTADLRSTIDVLHEAPQVQLVALFGPEHGVRGDQPAGRRVGDFRDPATGLPVYSLYGPTRKPTPEMLAGIDTLVFDIQDIGSRSYTYISTMALAMQAAAEQGIRFVVLDRPNPLGGERIEGRVLDPKFRSFVGYLPIPYVHGMTVGELAKMIVGERWLDGVEKLDLHVVPMKGWKRSMLWQDTGRIWVPTSPHIPRPDSAFFYAATGIMGELRVISEGVGYPLPFELAGLPGLSAERLAGLLNARRLPGVWFRPAYFQPYYGPYARKVCGGVQIILTDPRAAPLTPIQFHIIDAVRRLKPDLALFGRGRDAMFDKVCGTDQIRRLLEQDAPLDEVLRVWNEGVRRFRQERNPYLLYP